MNVLHVFCYTSVPAACCAQPWTGLGQVRDKQGDARAAASHFDQALRVSNGQSLQANLGLGNMMLRVGNYAEAELRFGAAAQVQSRRILSPKSAGLKAAPSARLLMLLLLCLLASTSSCLILRESTNTPRVYFTKHFKQSASAQRLPSAQGAYQLGDESTGCMVVAYRCMT